LVVVKGSEPGAMSRISVARMRRPTCSLKMPSTILSRESMAAVGSENSACWNAVSAISEISICRVMSGPSVPASSSAMMALY
jgi:hypothetical protein